MTTSTEIESTRHSIIATTDFEGLCVLSRSMCNTSGEELREGLVYMANRSIGGRKWTAGNPVSHVENDSGYWLGFEEEGAKMFEWSSASSDAVITADRQTDGSWLITFTGCDTQYRDESSYIVRFAHVCKKDSAKPTEELWNPIAIANALRGAPKANLCREFAASIGVEYQELPPRERW